jgi:hypothetical protein
MNRLAIGAALLALGVVAGPLCAAEPPPLPAARAPWYKRWFGIGPETTKPAPAPRRDPAAEAAALHAKAQAELDRRRLVCDEIRRIAEDTDNKALFAKADDLERQAFDLYMKQTVHLPCSRLLPSRDEKAFDQKLPTTTTAADVDNLTTPAISVPSRKAQASAIREIKP